MLPDRQKFVEYLTQAFADGARKALACHELGLTLRTLQRWTKKTVMLNPDKENYRWKKQPKDTVTRQLP